MRSFIIPALLIILLFTSCRHPRDKSYIGIPEDSIIGREQMIQMLVNVHIIEAALQSERVRGTDVTKMSAAYYQKLFSEYRVSEKRFRESMNYYKQDQDDFIKMYDAVIDSLKTRSSGLKVTAPVEE